MTGEGRSLGGKISGEGVVPGEYFLVSTKRDTSVSNGANCTVLRAVVLTDRQTDRRTDGIAVANTALAMRALRAL